MKTRQTLLVAGGLSAIVLSAMLVKAGDLRPLVVTNPAGTLRVQQDVPCGDAVDLTTPVAGGRIEMTPAEGVSVGGDKIFALTRLTLFFEPFSVHRDCLGFGDTRTYSEIGARLAGSVTFEAVAVGDRIYRVTIPKDSFLLYESVIDNGSPETSYKRPSEDVTGMIDLARGTVQLHAVLATKLHFREGCLGDACLINEDDDGTLTADMSGPIAFPDIDLDGVPDRIDNCPLVPNPDQTPVPTPVLIPPPGVTLNSCLDRHFGVAEATDVCRGRAVTVTSNAPPQFAIGSNLVTWSGNDGTDPTVSATQRVTIVDRTPPEFASIPPDIHLNNCQATPLGTPTATDDCAGAVTFTNDAPPKFFIGTTAVTWTASDVSGNQSTGTQHVTVVDTTPPTISCTAASPPGNSFRVVAADGCDVPTARLGSYVLANGEVIQIQETGQPGVRLINTIGPDHIRHFQVGKGEAIVTATDASGNVASAMCR